MSDNLPLEIQEEIMRRLPVKSLIQYRSVCKAWKSVIDSCDFIAHYSSQQQQQHLFVMYNHQLILRHDFEPSYFSIVDDETFPHQKFALTLPVFINTFQFHRIIGSSHGLLCLFGCYGDGSDGPEKWVALVWNISIVKAVAVVVPNLGDGIYGTALGFGVCGETGDPKIVKITDITVWEGVESIPEPDSIPWQVEVFTLSTGAWRSPYNNLPRTSIQFGCSQVIVDGFCYWLATDRSTIDAGIQAYNLIVSFNMTSEEFREVTLPDSLVYDGWMDYLHISNLKESLVVLEHDADENVFNVWLMDDGVSKSFTKQFTIYSPNATIFSVLEFRKNGEPVIEISDHDGDQHFAPTLLAVYEPKSKHITNLGINGSNLGISGMGSFYVYSYVETLLLLDQPELTVFDKGKSFIAKQRAEN